MNPIFKIIIFSLFLLGNISAQHPPEKINGISFYPPVKNQLTVEMIAAVRECHVDWVAFVPEAILERESLTLRSEKELGHFGKTKEGTTAGIAIAKSIGLKVMLKPHIELSAPIPVEEKTNYFSFFSFGEKEPLVSEKDKTNGATWRGDFAAKNETDWKTWEQCYESYILKWAMLADSLDVDLFCIGTELRRSATARAPFWRQLIGKVRKIYSGPLTYGANWDEYELVSFWEDLDYIGVDAYFPISASVTPTVAEVVNNWKPISQKLKTISLQLDRKVLITEFGYRNVDYAGLEPWTHDTKKEPSNELAQANLYKGFFQTFQQETYIAGSFLWQWIVDDQQPGNTSFSPKGKKGMEVLRKWYGR